MLTITVNANIDYNITRKKGCKEKMVTLKEIAERANVSTMTVSRALQKPESVNTETRNKIEAIANEMAYRPNALAQSLVLKRTNNILVIIPDLGNFFFPEMLTSTSEVMKKYGMNILIASSFGRISEEKRLLDMGLTRNVDGVILFVPRVESEYLVRIGSQFPIVVTDRLFESDVVKQVYLDTKEGAKEAVEYLISMGHKQIGLIEGPESVQANLNRKDGFCEALENNGIKIETRDVFEGDYSFQEGREALDYFVSRPQDIPTAYFATNDVMALGFIQRATEKGYSIPKDFSIIGFDNSQISYLTTPQLTTVDHPKKQMGALAAYEMLTMLGVKVEETPEYDLKNKLIIRNSVAQIDG